MVEIILVRVEQMNVFDVVLWIILLETAQRELKKKIFRVQKQVGRIREEDIQEKLGAKQAVRMKPGMHQLDLKEGLRLELMLLKLVKMLPHLM